MDVRRLTATSAGAGALVWVGVVALGALSSAPSPLTTLSSLTTPSPTRRLFLLAPLVVVPLCLGLVGDDVRRAALLQPPAALLAVGAVVLPAGPLSGVLALPWAGVTALLALAAVRRVLARRPEGDGPLVDLPAVLVDAGLLYSTVGSAALVLSASGVGLLDFPGVIVFLTAVHFHYAGLVVPVVAGVTGRALATAGRDRSPVVFRPVGWVVVVGPALVGVGITVSPLVEVVAVAAFTLAVAALAVLTLVAVARTLEPLPGALVGASALVLPASMALALAYGLSVYLGVPVGLDVPTMVRWHGHLNALGFALPAAVGWRLATAP